MKASSLTLVATTLLSMATASHPPVAMASDAYDDDSREERPVEDSWEKTKEEEEGLTAGELRPPESMAEHQHESSGIEEELEEADEKDAGRGLEFAWLEGDFGYGIFGLTTFSSNRLLGPDAPATAHGPLLGAGLGVRALYFTLGGRFRYGFLSNFKLISAGAELGLRVPLGKLEPHATLGLGYVTTNRMKPDDLAPERFSVKGIDLRLAGGLDYYLSDTFSVGGEIVAETAFLVRRAQDENGVCTTESECPYLEKGRSVGGGLSLVLSMGLHF